MDNNTVVLIAVGVGLFLVLRRPAAAPVQATPSPYDPMASQGLPPWYYQQPSGGTDYAGAGALAAGIGTGVGGILSGVGGILGAYNGS